MLPHFTHALGFASALVGSAPSPALDLGSGGGLPGLPLAVAWPESRWVLLDAGLRRTDFLRRAVDRLGLSDRVAVARGRAEELGRSGGPDWRGAFQLVVARGFGSPSVTAECSAPLLAVGGRLVVSEPPDSTGHRWSTSGLALLGMRPAKVCVAAGTSYQLIEQDAPCPERFPRRAAAMSRRPLF